MYQEMFLPGIIDTERKLFPTPSGLTHLLDLWADPTEPDPQVVAWSQLSPQHNGGGIFLQPLPILQVKNKISESPDRGPKD